MHISHFPPHTDKIIVFMNGPQECVFFKALWTNSVLQLILGTAPTARRQPQISL